MSERYLPSDEREALRIQKFETPLFQQHLRRSILNQSSSTLVLPFFTMKRLLSTMSLAAFLLAVGFFLNPFTQENVGIPVVSAQEVLNSTIQEFQSLTDAQIQALNERLGIPCEDVLMEARNASDLHFATIERSVVGDEVQYSFEDEGGAISMTGTNGSNDLDALTFLEYTREDGSIVRLGVNAQDDYMPTFIFTSSTENSAGEMTDVMIFNSSAEDANLEDSSSVTQTVEGCEGPSTSWTSEDGLMGGGGC